jgi:hypothetical protein
MDETKLNIKINPDALTIPDMALIMSATEATNATALIPQIADMLERVVVGGVKTVPASQFRAVFTEVVKQWGESANPKSPPAG